MAFIQPIYGIYGEIGDGPYGLVVPPWNLWLSPSSVKGSNRNIFLQGEASVDDIQVDTHNLAEFFGSGRL